MSCVATNSPYSLAFNNKRLVESSAFCQLKSTEKRLQPLLSNPQEKELRLPLKRVFSLISRAFKELDLNPKWRKWFWAQGSNYQKNLLIYFQSLRGRPLDIFYHKLRSIDPHLVNEERYNRTDGWTIQRIKSIYYGIVRKFTFKRTIERYQNRITVLISLLEMNRDVQKVIELFPKFFQTTKPIRTLDEIHEMLALCENDSMLLERKKWFENYLRTKVNSDIDYLLDPNLSLLIKPLIDNAQKHSNCSLGIASYSEDDSSARLTFSKQKKLRTSVPFFLGMVDETAPHMQAWRKIGVSENVQMLTTNHCAPTSEWRKRLIRAAEHNIVISGNYCGGKAFDEVLELIKARLEENVKLKVVIISSPRFIKEDPEKNIRNVSLISELKQKYPERFSVVYSDDVTINGGKDGFKKVTNHTKYTGIDFGRYYIMGGSGIKDSFDLSGVDNPFELLEDELREEFAFLRERLIQIKESWDTTPAEDMMTWISDAKAFDQKLRRSPHYSPKAFESFFKDFHKNIALLLEGKENPSLHRDKRDQPVVDMSHGSEISARDPGLIGRFVPGNFRDMDFVFSDPNEDHSSGQQLFLETTRLAYRWEALNEGRNESSPVPVYTPQEVSELPIFTGGEAVAATPEDTVTQLIMKEPMLPASALETGQVEGFEGVETGSIEMLYQGPESPTGRSAIAEKALDLIRHAKNRIVFNHMYFAPTHEIMQALKEAVERGVKVEIITAAATENCPNGQLLFGPYNRWHWAHLAAIVKPEVQQNIEIYAYQQKKEKGLHKKVIVVDDTVLAGSSNFGYKSLVTSSDHESNFVAKSKPFAERTLAVCEEDKARSKRIKNKTSMSLLSYINAGLYSLTKHLAN